MSNKKKLKRDLESHQETQRAVEYKNLEFTIILVRPEHSENIGSVARIMANFDFEKLVIFNPIEYVENIFNYHTHGFAMHGKEILMNAKVIELKEKDIHTSELKKYLDKFNIVLATTSKGKRFSNIQRLAIFPEKLILPSSPKPLKIAILFGRESRGLDNEEIGLVDVILRIPTGSSYPTLNISHACGIILYEIFKKVNRVNIGRGKNPVLLASRENRQSLLKIVEELIEKLKVRTHKKEKVYFAFRNVFERAFMSRKELSLITGIFSKVESILEHKKLY
ncbi:MAG: TrmJ/YjtD family RNA methyltransferase [Candidatus Lokiarchaeota archaeon]|nr:TrmJ/YjtD family RNA methyltransferase [Candidatus Lokiarchaeota archaeon]